MIRVKPSLFTAIFIATALTFFSSCEAAGGGKSALVGRWDLVEGPTTGNPEGMELLSDGTGIVDKTGITYKTESGRFYITLSSRAMSYGYKVSGSMLTLTKDDGTILKYIKKGSKEAKVWEAKKKVQEEINGFKTWVFLQKAYMLETGNVGNCEQISYKLPGNGRTENFAYSCKLENGVAYWTAENNKNLEECPAGNQWILLMKSGDDDPEVHLPKNKNCQEFTPNFSKLGNVKD